MNKVKFFSVFAGTFFEIPEKHVQHMDCGQIPLKDFPKASCKHCFGRGYTGTDVTSGHFQMCSCVIKQIDPTRVVHQHIHDINLNPKYNQ